MKKRIGVLGLQGDFALHQTCITRAGCESPVIRYPEELEECDGLILPGGESTTFVKLLHKTGLFEAIREFSKTRPVMGTCAGLITLAARVSDESVETLNCIDIEVERNGYGRQIDSFVSNVTVPGFKKKPSFEGVFIRAPKILSSGSSVTPLGYLDDEVVLAGSRRVLVMTFHPELTSDLRIHRYFIETYVR